MPLAKWYIATREVFNQKKDSSISHRHVGMMAALVTKNDFYLQSRPHSRQPQP